MTETDIQHCRHCRFSVAGFTFSVGIPSSVDADRLLPSFRDFRCGGQALPERDIFRMEQSPGTLRPDTGLRFIEETGTDIGLTCLYEAGQKYYMEIRHTDGSPVHQMLASKDFSRVEARIDWTDRYAGNSLCSMLRIAYSQAVLLHGAVSVHASVICLDGKAYLFAGKSGTGKSTHSALWLRHIPGSFLLNDDNPVIRLSDGIPTAFGTPWSGKTPCYRNEGFPVAGIARLSQAPENRFIPKHDVEAFSLLLTGCSFIRQDGYLLDALCGTLVETVQAVRCGILECRPDAQAAVLCHKSLTGIGEYNFENK